MEDQLDTTAPEMERQVDTTPAPHDSDVRRGQSDETPDPEIDAAEELYGVAEHEIQAEAPVEPSRPQVSPSPAETKPQIDPDDAVTLVHLEHAAKDFERDLRDFGLAQQKLAQMAQTDPERARAYATRLAEAQNELRERYGTLQEAAQTVQQSQWNRRIESERERLHQAVPELSRPESQAELKQWLLKDAGFSEQEIAAHPDARLVKMAWEAMQFRRMKAAAAKKGPPKIPTPPSKKRAAAAKRQAADPLAKMYGANPRRFSMPKQRNDDIEALYGKGQKS